MITNKELTKNSYIFLDKENEICLVLDKSKFNLLKIPYFIGCILKDVSANINFNSICNKYNLSQEDLENTILKFNSNFKKISYINKFKEDSKSLKLLRLIITNTCNLKCKYCYANEGTYQTSDNYTNTNAKMKISDAKKIIDNVLLSYEEIDEISFFGGEPFLNFDVIKEIINYIVEKVNEGKLKKIPRFSTVTNGTIVTKEIIELINKFNIHVVVSLDGPKDVNDQLRITKTDSGTYDLIEKNILYLKKYTNQPSIIECTYTSKHIKNGYNKKNLLKFFKDKFDIKIVHICPVSIENDSLRFLELDIHEKKVLKKDNIDERFNEFLYSNIYDSTVIKFLTIFNTKSLKFSKYYCNAGIEQITINVNGDIFPCQLFTSANSNEFYMGNLLNENLNNEKFISVRKKLSSNSKLKYDKCITCEEKYICSTCIGHLYKDKGIINPISQNYCNTLKEFNNNCINAALKIYSDKEKYKILIDRLEDLKMHYDSMGE